MLVASLRAGLALVLGLGGVLAVSPPPARAVDAPALAITVAPSNGGTLGPKGGLPLAVTISNPTDGDVSAATVTASVNRTPIGSRDSLADWFAGPSKKGIEATSVVARQDVPLVAAASTRLLQVAVPASALRLNSPGVYAVDVSLSAGGVPLGEARTAVAVKPDNKNPVRIALAAPLVLPTDATGSDGFIPAKTLETYTAPGGILSDQLDAMAGAPIAIGIDPRILASIRVLGKGAPQSARDWLDRLHSAPNETFPLGWADFDVTAPLQAGEIVVPAIKALDFNLDATQFPASADAGANASTASTPTPTATPGPAGTAAPDSAALVAWDYALPSTLWPSANSVTTETLTRMKKTGATSLILASGNVSREATTGIPGADATVAGMRSAVADTEISALFTAAVQAPSESDWAAAMARLSTAVAQIGALSPARAPTILATSARSWSSSGYRLAQTISALYSSRQWVTGERLTAAFGTHAPVAKLINRPEPTGRIAVVKQLFDAERSEVRFAGIVKVPSTLVSERRLQLLSLLSNAWMPDPAGLRLAASRFLKGSSRILTSVQVVNSSPVLFLNDRGALPVTVSNELPQPATVYVAVRPLSSALSVPQKYRLVPVTLEGESQRKVQIPVRSLANGQVQADVSLYAKNGDVIGVTKTVDIDVQAGWETAGTLIGAGFVFAIFGVGLYRNIRKRRKVRRE